MFMPTQRNEEYFSYVEIEDEVITGHLKIEHFLMIKKGISSSPYCSRGWVSGFRLQTCID